MRGTAAILLAASIASSQTLVQTIPLPGVEGRIDHMSVDVKGRRLFVSALGNNSLEVIDLAAGKVTRSIPDLHEPQGVLYVPDFNRVFLASREDGKCRIFDADSWSLIGAVDFGDDADNLRYDAGSRLVYAGFGEGALGIIDADSGKKAGEIPLQAHPESFQLEGSGTRIFVNVPDAGQIAVIDRATRKVAATWALHEPRANFPMALDESAHRLFVVCRKPAHLLVLDTATGRTVARLVAARDADDVFYDGERRRIYISGGDGLITTIEQKDADHYALAARVATAPGARTSFFAPQFRRLYVAVPHRGRQKAEIRIYE